MISAAQELKMEIDAVKAIGVYDVAQKKFLHEDPNLSNIPFLLRVAASNTWSETLFAFFNTNKEWLYITSKESIFVFISLKHLKNVNRVLLEIKTRKLLSEY